MAELILSLGGKLGFFCNHQYAHAHDAGRKSIPAAFKGVDLAVFTAFHSLGLKPTVRPVLMRAYYRWGGMSVKELFDMKDVKEFNERMNPTRGQEEDEYEEESDEVEYGRGSDNALTMVGTNMHGLAKNDDYDEESDKVSYCHKCLDLFCLLLLGQQSPS